MKIVYRATVEGVSTVDVALRLLPAADGEEPLVKDEGFDRFLVNVPGAANASDVGETLRAFGTVFGIEGAVRVTIEVDRA